VKNIFYKFAIILFGIGCPLFLRATHNRAGEITYRQTGPLSIEMTITTYTKASSVAADRDSLEMYWGDGSIEWIKRDNARTRFEPNDIRVNYYVASHTYPGAASYTMSFLDPNRVGGILNINYPNSIDIPFFLSTTFTLLDQQFQGFNNSAILLQPPLDFACVNKVFIHNPNAYDVDKDSLAYEFAVPLQGVNMPVPDYKLPDQIGAVIGNQLTINAVTGEIRWDSPKLQGEYNIAIRIKEYRNGKLINVILRDMQILVRACENDPPTIKALNDLCVVAGQKISIPIEVNDPNLLQKVRLSATGGPFKEQSSAKLTGPTVYTAVPFKANFEWQTNCNHISNQYYQIVLRAVDNFYGDSSGLATLLTFRIKVVGPSPENLTASSENNKIKLEWDAPYACEVTNDRFFQGFSVWRKIASSSFQPDTCNPGLTGSPYQKIVFKTTAKENGKYYYNDDKIENGNTYCYRVIAEFASLTSSSNPFNKVESLPSNEACIILLRNLPLITKASVTNTSSSNGMVHIRWTKPIPQQLDTILNPGPYKYEIRRKSPGGSVTLISTIETRYFGNPLDTNMIDANINTLDNQYFYFITLYSNNKKIGDSPDASTLYLTINPTDKKNMLSWTSKTPWSNTRYSIFLRNSTGTFVKLAETSATIFEHQNLKNDSLYCYKIESTGTYSVPGMEDPILNFSEEVCRKPLDNVPSCAPELKVLNICSKLSNNIRPEDLYNTVSWTDPALKCKNLADDIASFNIYFGETTKDSLIKIGNQRLSDGYTYIHYPNSGLSGCYAVTSIDLNGNESAKSNVFCVDNCPFYELPNTFTPNNDGKNDVFRPRINLFVAQIEMKVYNQWGNLVFETNDPLINWDGTTQNGAKLSDGTYQYICRVFENRVSGVTESKKPLSGFIHIIRN
jgi:gliding motility-associated-like protein